MTSTFEVRFGILLSRLLWRSVELVFSKTRGAGGSSISSTLEVISFVDSRSSPGFRRFRIGGASLAQILLIDGIFYGAHHVPISPSQVSLLRQELEGLYNDLIQDLSTRTISANARDQYGQNLLMVRKTEIRDVLIFQVLISTSILRS